MTRPPTKTKTSPGLGDSGINRIASQEMKRFREALEEQQRETPTPAEGTPTRRRRSDRPPVVVDDVGDAAVTIARTRRESAPKLVASRALIAKAPIDTRAAFVLSLVDGRNSVGAIVDMAGMPEEEVKSLLERLARLGLITLR